LKLVACDQIHPRPFVSRGCETKVQRRWAAQTGTATPDTLGQWQGAAEAAVMGLGIAADACLAQGGVWPTLADGTAAGQDMLGMTGPKPVELCA